MPDPKRKSLAEVRTIRDAIEARVEDLLEHRINAIRSDRSPHQRRLEQLLRPLAEEFQGTRSPEEIRLCADAILGRFDGAPVRSFVISLAFRHARECLRAEVCEPLLV